jgi:thiamine phosphate synthase YjbQ (UPF0047 family)
MVEPKKNETAAGTQTHTSTPITLDENTKKKIKEDLDNLLNKLDAKKARLAAIKKKYTKSTT